MKKAHFTGTVKADARTYSFEVKDAKNGSQYLIITEASKKGGRSRQTKLLIFSEHLTKFQDVLNEAVSTIMPHIKRGR
jgi:hypothetical protein